MCHEAGDGNRTCHLEKEVYPGRRALQSYTEEPVHPVDAEDEEEDERGQDEGADEAEEKEHFGGFHKIPDNHPAHP